MNLSPALASPTFKSPTKDGTVTGTDINKPPPPPLGGQQPSETQAANNTIVTAIPNSPPKPTMGGLMICGSGTRTYVVFNSNISEIYTTLSRPLLFTHINNMMRVFASWTSTEKFKSLAHSDPLILQR